MDQGFVEVPNASAETLNDAARKLNAEGWQILEVLSPNKVQGSSATAVTLFIQRRY